MSVTHSLVDPKRTMIAIQYNTVQHRTSYPKTHTQLHTQLHTPLGAHENGKGKWSLKYVPKPKLGGPSRPPVPLPAIRLLATHQGGGRLQNGSDVSCHVIGRDVRSEHAVINAGVVSAWHGVIGLHHQLGAHAKDRG